MGIIACFSHSYEKVGTSLMQMLKFEYCIAENKISLVRGRGLYFKQKGQCATQTIFAQQNIHE